MPAQLITHERQRLTDDVFKEAKIWRLPAPMAGCTHVYKYSLTLVFGGECVIRYDNERGKGDHKHIDGIETPIRFIDLATLFAEFHRDIHDWRQIHGHTDDSR